ncbi:MAG: tetratricopeptide repeat protein [Ignavibacteriota bacterium]
MLPQDRDIPLLRATVLELSAQSDEAERLLTTLQNRWPEWPAAWAAHGIAQFAHGRYDDARRTLETATALGAHSAEVRACLAESTLRGTARRDATAATGDPRYLQRLLQEKPPRDW